MQLILNCILFCFVVLLSFGCFSWGFYFGRNKGTEKRVKPQTEQLTLQQQAEIKKNQKQEQNFWGYNGESQQNSQFIQYGE